MQIKSKYAVMMLMTILAVTLWAGGCSEEDPTYVDVAPPEVQLYHPVSHDKSTYSITDSITFRVLADDLGGIESVEIWCTYHADTLATRLGEAQLREGNEYTLYWETIGTQNGAEGVLWVVATDCAGNQGWSTDKVPIRVINSGQIRQAIPRFFVTPSSGTVATSFLFNPTDTSDDIDRDDKILVRWDFDGDGIWDIDTTEHKNASEIVRHKYNTPGIYNAQLEAYNTYFPTAAPPYEVEVVVTPEHGMPRPPNPDNFVAIPSGDYPIGVIETGGVGSAAYDSRELVPDTLVVRISNRYFIEKTEVTNALYVGFLNAARDSGFIEFDPFAGEDEVRWAETGNTIIRASQDVSRVKFLDQQTGFGVDTDYQYHPVTGVSWYGALAYAAFYGLRLPTEVEWEVAARGDAIDFDNSGYYLYPWEPGDLIDGAWANYGSSGDPYEVAGVLMTTPTGEYNGEDMLGFPTQNAVSVFGTYDQAGNVAEWVRDWYDHGIYEEMYDQYDEAGIPALDPQGPETGWKRVYRGGDFTGSPEDLRVTRRRATIPETMVEQIGFRTAYADF